MATLTLGICESAACIAAYDKLGQQQTSLVSGELRNHAFITRLCKRCEWELVDTGSLAVKTGNR